MTTPALRRAVWLLGAGQCVYWGVLYYAFAVLLVGRLLDRGHGALLLCSPVALLNARRTTIATVAAA